MMDIGFNSPTNNNNHQVITGCGDGWAASTRLWRLVDDTPLAKIYGVVRIARLLSVRGTVKVPFRTRLGLRFVHPPPSPIFFVFYGFGIN